MSIIGKYTKIFKRYIILYFLFVKNSVVSEMEYRVNFIAKIVLEVTYLFIKITYVLIVYEAGVSVRGISANGMFIFMGCYVLMTGLYCSLFFLNFIGIQGHVRNGTLDFYITKPISLQFITTLRKFDLGFSLPNIIGGILLISIGWYREGIPVSLGKITAFIGFIIIGIIINYAVFLLPNLLSFWVVKMNGMNAVSNAIWDLNQMPMLIYGKWIQRIGLYIVPIFLISNFAPLFILGKLEEWHILWIVLAPIIFMTITRMFWKKAIRKYVSVNN